MSIVGDIKNQIKEAMKSKDKLRLDTLRGISAAFVNELVASGQKPDAEVSDDLALKVLKRALKQRKEAAEQFRAGGRDDLAEKEEKEAEIIQEFLPEQLSEEKIEDLAKECIADSGASGKQDFAKVMPCVMQKAAGAADGALVKQVVERLLG